MFGHVLPARKDVLGPDELACQHCEGCDDKRQREWPRQDHQNAADR